MDDPKVNMGKGHKKVRTAAPGIRHRRDNGPAELEVEEVPPPKPQELGTLTRYTQEILSGGPRALIAAQHKAAGLAEKFGEEFEAKWCLATPYILSLAKGVDPAKSRPDDPPNSSAISVSPSFVSFSHSSVSDTPETAHPMYSMTARNRARARFAMHWRPKFLAVLALTKAPLIAARAARVSWGTVYNHRKADPDFDEQWIEAEDHAIQLLHDVTMKSAIEGECEPVFWQGIQVGHVRKVDNRLRIEMLRAHMPSRFKTPGSGQAPLIAGDGNKVMIIDAATRAELVAMRQEALQAMKLQLPDPPNGGTGDSDFLVKQRQEEVAAQEKRAMVDSGNSPTSVQ